MSDQELSEAILRELRELRGSLDAYAKQTNRRLSAIEVRLDGAAPLLVPRKTGTRK